MVSLASLWLPILVSAVVVYIASSIVWMFLPHHRSDWKELPNESAVLEALRGAGVDRGQYRFPFGSPRDKSPEAKKRMELRPMGTMVLWPPGKMAMGPLLAKWFGYLLLVSACVAAISGRVLPMGAAYRTVFHTVGGIAILAYASALVPNAIWWGRSWSATFKDIADGVVYGLLTAGVFGWLWPR